MSERLLAEVNGGDEVRTVTLNMRNVSLKEILAEIEKQAGVTFSYESSLLKEFPPRWDMVASGFTGTLAALQIGVFFDHMLPEPVLPLR